MNSVNLVGRLTRDPEQRQLPNDAGAVCDMRLAVDNSRSDRSIFIDVFAFGKLGESCVRYLAQGRQVAVTGRLDYREWSSNGSKRSKHSIVASDVQFLGPKPEQRQPVTAGADDDIPL